MEPQPISNLLERLKVEPLQTGLQPFKHGELSRLEKAVSSPLIKESDAESLNQVLRLVMMKLGIRAHNLPSEEETHVLVEHIVINFGGHRIEEIKLAFEMAIGEQLELDTKDISCYENFSCAYFSRIMNAYRLWARQEIKQVAVPHKYEQKIFSQEELDDSAREAAERQYQLFVRGYDAINLSINREILLKDKLLKEGESVPDFFFRMHELKRKNIYVKK